MYPSHGGYDSSAYYLQSVPSPISGAEALQQQQQQHLQQQQQHPVTLHHQQEICEYNECFTGR